MTGAPRKDAKPWVQRVVEDHGKKATVVSVEYVRPDGAVQTKRAVVVGNLPSWIADKERKQPAKKTEGSSNDQ